MLNQKLQQKLLQKLSPQQILLMKLLQIPSVAIEQRIKQEIEENPALEDISDPDIPTENDSIEDREHQDNNENNEDNYDSKDDEFNFEDYLDEEDVPSYKLSSNNYSAEDDKKEVPFVSGVSFHEFLAQQLGENILDDQDYLLATYMIGNIDDSGYLQRDLESMVNDLAFSQNITTDEDKLKEILAVIQTFDPSGVGARSLQECLLIQLKRKFEEESTQSLEHAIVVIDRYFNEFTKKHYQKIMRRSGISSEDLKEAINEVLRLNPKPGNSLSETSKTNHYIIPDFIVTNHNGELELSLSSKNSPELRLSKSYLDMLQSYADNKKSRQQKDALTFVKQKIDAAKWFIDAIKQRQNTLLVTMNAILTYQQEYFLTGDETKIRPMILKDIAEIVNLDISTISRVANSKYVQTPFGTFLLKSFFSESMEKSSGEEVSTREIKKILEDCVDSENKSKPLTDEQLTNILVDKGYKIARRTVAKYREQLNISVARLRKEL
ncbi:MAG: RNA polymerase factor sigma-54 [Hyphomicrobiales bacterium]